MSPSQPTSPWQKYRLSSPNLHDKSTNWVSPNLYDIARLSFTKIYKRKAFQNLHDKNQIHLTNVQIQAKRNNKWCITLWPGHLHKKVSEGKRRIIEIEIFHHAKIQSFKTSSKRNQNPSRYRNSITNLKFKHKPKYNVSKILV